MRTTRKILAWVLTVCMTLGLLPSAAIPARAEETGTAVVVNAMDYGADPAGATDSAEAITTVTSSGMSADDPLSDLVYVSTNPDVVSVNAAGEVTAIAAGTSQVYAYYVWHNTITKSNAVSFTVTAGEAADTTAVEIGQEGTVILNDANTSAVLTANTAVTWSVADFLTGGNDVTFSQLRVCKASEGDYDMLMAEDAIPIGFMVNLAPSVSNVAFDAASYAVGEKAAVTYTYSDPNGDPEGESLYLWSYGDTIGSVEIRWNNYRQSVAMTKTAEGCEGEISFVTGLNSYYVTVTTKTYTITVNKVMDPNDSSRDIPVSVLTATAGDWQMSTVPIWVSGTGTNGTSR